MKAAVLEAFNEPLTIRDIPEPEVASDEVLVRVQSVGLCGTDLKINSGALEATTRLPLVTGHEIAGKLVKATGDLPAETNVACYFYTPCGTCEWCRRGETEICPESQRLGFERNGGLASYVAVRADSVLPFSARLDPAAAAVAMDAVTTPWHALAKRACLRPSERVLIVGAGGLGLNGVQVAHHLGAVASAVDPQLDRIAAARALGAEPAVTPADISEVLEWSDGGVDVALDTSGVRAGFDLAVSALRAGGRLVCCGYAPGSEYGLDSARLVLDEVTVLGSRLGSLDDARESLAAVQEGHVKPPIARRFALDQVNAALETLARAEEVGRIVVDVG